MYSREFVGKALELARLYGWRPMGTRLPVMQEFWLGRYLTNDGQIVLTEDALALAGALGYALDDIPNENRKTDWNDPKLWLEDDLPDWFSPEEREIIEDGLEELSADMMELHPYDFFAGDEKKYLMEFIRFCHLGSFTIL
jgi:hypothetical protein